MCNKMCLRVYSSIILLYVSANSLWLFNIEEKPEKWVQNIHLINEIIESFNFQLSYCALI